MTGLLEAMSLVEPSQESAEQVAELVLVGLGQASPEEEARAAERVGGIGRVRRGGEQCVVRC